MADIAHDAKKSEGAEVRHLSVYEYLKIVGYIVVFVIVGAVVVVVAFLDEESANNFLNFLYGIEILLGLYIMYLLYLFWHHMKRFDHHVHELEHMFAGKTKKSKKVNLNSDPLWERFERSKKHITSQYREEWKIGIIELDTILRDLLKKNNYIGDTVAELLKYAESKGFKNVNAAWDAHRVRNQIVHEGVKFEMSNDSALRALRNYTTAFEELGIKPPSEVQEISNDNEHH
jgi:hypothetical protein